MAQGERVKEVRKALGFTLEKFGERLGVGKTAVSKIEHEQCALTDQMAKSICREFSINEEWLRTGSGEMRIPVEDEAVAAVSDLVEKSKLAPPFEWCPTCGESLTGKDLNAEQAMERAEYLLSSMKHEALRMIESTDLQETRKAWYHSHLGSLDFARQIGLITEERRQQLYKEFQKEANHGADR